MANDLTQMARSKGIYLTLSLWSMLSPKLAGNESSKGLPKDHGNGVGKQGDAEDVDGKDESLGSPRVGGI
jgi:hypothetical protein